MITLRMARRAQPVLVLHALALPVLVLLASAPVRAQDWVLDKAQSHIGFTGTQTGTRFAGEFGRYDGEIALDPAHPESGHIEVTIDLASAHTGDTQRDTALPGADWFDVAQFPKARFVSTAIRSVGEKHYEALGTLSLRNVTRPVTLRFTLEAKDGNAHAQGQADLVRTAFGVGQGPWASGQWVALEVGVTFDLVAHGKK
ncbi:MULTISPECIES: YceI family protein [unclassified Asaia]|uniref:YceI family protein n=1 Tax=unclassified Asaia TaxID=2685023 RepID=UPI001F35CB7F|nr:YceI family protein [Asaia sp. W19]